VDEEEFIKLDSKIAKLADRMKPCISEAVTLPFSFAEDVNNYADAACPAMEVWLTKLEQFLAGHSIEDARDVTAKHGLKLAVASVQGGILLAQGDARRESFALFERRLKLCRELQIPTLVVVADFDTEVGISDYERGVVSLKQAARLAADLGVRLALEFQGRSKFCNNLSTAASLVNHCGESNVGLCFDVFHYYTGPSKFEDLGLLSQNNLFHVQFSDLTGVPRELAGDSDRVLPGDGDFQLAPIIERFRTIGYTGFVSIELMNPLIWQMRPAQVAEVAITAVRKLLLMTDA
jgi:sugar phosphate isomerase/epimerase